MLKEVKCNMCGKEHYRVLYKSKVDSQSKDELKYLITETFLTMPERIVRCLGCGLIYMNPRRSKRELLNAYTEMVDETYASEEVGKRNSAKVILERLKRFRKRGCILDVGCATAFLLDEAKKQGWEVYGVELSKWCVEYAKRNFSIDVFLGTLDRAGFKKNFFDVVVLNDTIEHLTDPKGTLIYIRKLLKPDGILCVSTPNIGSLVSKILRAKWWGINQFHLFYFTKKSLFKMLDIAGFTPVACKNHPRTFTFRYWTKRFEYYNKYIYSLLRFLSDKTFLGDRLLTINTFDQIEVYAKKSRKLIYLDELEAEPEAPDVKKKQKVVVVLPAYNAGKTLRKTVQDIPTDIVDEIILVDDKSSDNTVEVAKRLGLKVFTHKENKGYGANQKTCYTEALKIGADIVVMVHPDYQYDPKAIPALIEPIKEGRADAVFGSRMMKGGALIGGMPLWKHNTNIILTAIENVVFGTYLTEYHSGFRAYSARVLRSIRFMDNSDGFIFDTEIIVQLLLKFFRIEEVPIRTRYFDEASVIKLWPAILYGLGILKLLLKYILHTHTFIKFRQFE